MSIISRLPSLEQTLTYSPLEFANFVIDERYASFHEKTLNTADAISIIGLDQRTVTLPYGHASSGFVLHVGKSKQLRLLDLISLKIDIEAFSSLFQGILKGRVEFFEDYTAKVNCLEGISHVVHYKNISYDGLRYREIRLVLPRFLPEVLINLVAEYVPSCITDNTEIELEASQKRKSDETVNPYGPYYIA